MLKENEKVVLEMLSYVRALKPRSVPGTSFREEIA
jgi:hypothetical protein